MKGSSVFLIDQTRLPFEFHVVECKTSSETCAAIKNMTVRGAGAIGATAGFALAQAFLEGHPDIGRTQVEGTRPTAKNLFTAVNRVWNAASKSKTPAITAVQEAEIVADDDAASCRKIGDIGKDLIRDGFGIETHCNAGWLAFVDYGSALSPIYAAQEEGKKIHVYVDETRPRSQGARLTAWELKNENVPHSILPDNAGAFYMAQGKIQMMITGADRIAANGDTANKIGTLEKAICAKRYGIPFYVAAPSSTFDLDCPSGAGIPIESRHQDEVLYQTGPTKDGRIETILVCSPGSSALNPAFDVTPADLITGIITEKGLLKAEKQSIAQGLHGKN